MSSLWNEFLHNCITHPLMFFTRDAAWVVRWHDKTAKRAWPEEAG